VASGHLPSAEHSERILLQRLAYFKKELQFGCLAAVLHESAFSSFADYQRITEFLL
jgi:hypothetical protein